MDKTSRRGGGESGNGNDTEMRRLSSRGQRERHKAGQERRLNLGKCPSWVFNADGQ